MLKDTIEISSRMLYIKNEKAKRVAEFLLNYMVKDENNVYSNGTIFVPMYRVLDALAMIDDDVISYREG